MSGNFKKLLFELKKEAGSDFPGNELKLAGSPVSGLPYATKQLQEAPGAWTFLIEEADLQNLHPLQQRVGADGHRQQRQSCATQSGRGGGCGGGVSLHSSGDVKREAE
jgi:hypothetical protein